MDWKALFPGKKARKEALMRQAEAILTDFLEYGPWVRIISQGQYMGILSLRIRQQRGCLVFVISMYDTGPLSCAAGPFLKKYKSYYDPQLEGFRVFLKLPGYKENENIRLLEMEILARISRHPMARLRPDGKIQTIL